MLTGTGPAGESANSSGESVKGPATALAAVAADPTLPVVTPAKNPEGPSDQWHLHQSGTCTGPNLSRA